MPPVLIGKRERGGISIENAIRWGGRAAKGRGRGSSPTLKREGKGKNPEPKQFTSGDHPLKTSSKPSPELKSKDNSRSQVNVLLVENSEGEGKVRSRKGVCS